MAMSDASSPKPAPVSKRRSAEVRLDQPVGIGSGHRDVEHFALGEIPRRVQAHRQPQAAGQHVGGAEHHAGLERDRRTAATQVALGLTRCAAPKNAEVSKSANQLPPNSSSQRNRIPRNSSSSVKRREQCRRDEREQQRPSAPFADDVVDAETAATATTKTKMTAPAASPSKVCRAAPATRRSSCLISPRLANDKLVDDDHQRDRDKVLNDDEIMALQARQSGTCSAMMQRIATQDAESRTQSPSRPAENRRSCRHSGLSAAPIRLARCHSPSPVRLAVEPNGERAASDYSTSGSSGAADRWPSAASSLRLRSRPPA